MKIIKEEKNSLLILNTKEIFIENIPNLNSTSKKILHYLSKKEYYPKELAKKMGIHEQNLYYYISKLEKSNLISIIYSKNINGTQANYYKLSSESFYFRFSDFKHTTNIYKNENSYFNSFIKNGELDALIIVGSPDPHGPQKARSKDGYYGMDFALFLGSFLTNISNCKVKLDTEVDFNNLSEENLIIIGGSIVNKITNQINNHLPIYYDEQKKGFYSKITNKTYFSDECGAINLIEHPNNKNKKILSLVGLRNSGTKACILSYLKYFDIICKGNKFEKNTFSNVVEGIDLDSDGKVDDLEFLE